MELKFQGLKEPKIRPVSEQYTCEIIDSTLIIDNGMIYWCYSGDVKLLDLDSYNGTLICTSQQRFRTIDIAGNQDYFFSL